MYMLVLTRKRGESLHIGNGIVITILDVRPSRTRIGIDAPQSIRVERDERRCLPENVKEAIDVECSRVVHEDLVKIPGSSGALGGFENSNVTVAGI